jgi:hypothetical protein
MAINEPFLLNFNFMKTSLIFITLILHAVSTAAQSSDNRELQEIYNTDQSDRMADAMDWSVVSKRDSLRELRVYELLKKDKVQTANDFENAAMIFQHGGDTIATGMVVKLMRKAIALDSTRSKWLLAAGIDRDLMYKNKPQIYGTQYSSKGPGTPYELYQIDTTIITDMVRKEYGVRTLVEQREEVFHINKKTLFTVFENGWSNNEILKVLELEKSKVLNSDYDLREIEVRSVAHGMMISDKMEQALIISKFNTELYPTSADTYEMYGRFLLKLNRREEGIAAYKKCLILNTSDKEIEKIIKEYEGK